MARPTRPKTQVVTTRLTDEQIEQLDELGLRENRSRANLIAHLVEIGIRSVSRDEAA